MPSEETTLKVIDFFENIEKYYGCRTEITEILSTETDNFDTELSTWNLSEFILIRSAYRKAGDRFMIEGEKKYYEISAKIIVNFKQTGRNKFEFIERYSDSVFRIMKIKFHYKY